ncbi:DUF4230 domain-containing protein [Tepidibacter hydrothermalis]|uniref:DUF4230 domain-containing protein n=1 Tax=Tepidibacter hydrothermalis TaxID=3036126 RepID=A0ABY8EAA4_9FIRM|nr:DUF4230 domain-containing protein [Tepidibacter hydrothermalis]WFD09863.1 DUF4230 domain-containing protein [Tepidibacter hydrothermalis]
MIDKNDKNKILMILLSIFIVFTILTSGNILKLNKEKDSTTIFSKISQIQELSVNKYYYTNVVSFKQNKKIKDLEIPFTQKSFLIKYDGIIRTGIDLNDVKIIENKNNKIKLKIKKAQILDHTIDEKSMYVYDEKTSLFNKLQIKDVFTEISKEKKSIEEKMIKEGFLEQSNKNTQKLLENILTGLGYENIEIIY